MESKDKISFPMNYEYRYPAPELRVDIPYEHPWYRHILEEAGKGTHGLLMIGGVAQTFEVSEIDQNAYRGEPLVLKVKLNACAIPFVAKLLKDYKTEVRCEHCGVVGGGHTQECIGGAR